MIRHHLFCPKTQLFVLNDVNIFKTLRNSYTKLPTIVLFLRKVRIKLMWPVRCSCKNIFINQPFMLHRKLIFPLYGFHIDLQILLQFIIINVFHSFRTNHFFFCQNPKEASVTHCMINISSVTEMWMRWDVNSLMGSWSTLVSYRVECDKNMY